MDMEPFESDTDISRALSDETSAGWKTGSQVNTQYLTDGVAVNVKEETVLRRPSLDEVSADSKAKSGSGSSESSSSDESYEYSLPKTPEPTRAGQPATVFSKNVIAQEENLEEEEVPEAEAGPCSEFVDKIAFAKTFIESVLEEGEERTLKKKESLCREEESSPSFKFFSNESLVFGDDDDEFKLYIDRPEFSHWPSISDFTISVGAYKIDEYLSSFKTTEEWLYVIYYLGVIVDSCSELHRYEAIYSLPTFRYPVAQATASLYFTMEVCRSKPAQCPVDVTFQYESFRFKHKPGESDFKEMWLHYILTSKINFFRTLTF